MGYESFAEDVLDNIANAEKGSNEVFGEEVMEKLFRTEGHTPLFSTIARKFGIFLDPAEKRDSSGLIVASEVGRECSRYCIHAVRRQPPQFLRYLKETVVQGGKFLARFTEYEHPVHVVMDVTGKPRQIEKIREEMGQPEDNIRDHMIESAKEAKHEHVIGNEETTAWGIKFGSCFAGTFEAWKEAQISKEFMVAATIHMIEKEKIILHPEIDGAGELQIQMEEFKSKVIENESGRTISFRSENDDLVDALLMMGYWSYHNSLLNE